MLFEYQQNHDLSMEMVSFPHVSYLIGEIVTVFHEFIIFYQCKRVIYGDFIRNDRFENMAIML